MEIKCFARDFLPNKPPSNTILISINNYKQGNVKNNYEDCLYLTFDDITFKHNPYILFNKSHFNQIIYFVTKHKGKNIHINCTAGISRSGAIALGIAMYYNDKELYWETLKNNMIIPNDYILSYFQLKFKRVWFSWFNTVNMIINKRKNNAIDKIIQSEVVGNDIIRNY